MLVSVSWIKDHEICPTFAYNRNVKLRGPAANAVALSVGSIWHEAMAARLRGETFAASLDTMSPRVADEWAVLAPVANAWDVPADWQVELVEHEMRLPAGPHTFVGRLDALVKWNESWWHVQHKTLAQGVPIEVFAEQQRTDWHECLYQRMAEHADYRPFAGTILNICRKLSKSVRRDGNMVERHPLEFLVEPMYLRRSDQIVDAAILDMMQIAGDIEDEIGSRRRISKNRSACAGAFRNSLCVYKGCCDGGITLDDEQFVDLEVRYADVEKDANDG